MDACFLVGYAQLGLQSKARIPVGVDDYPEGGRFAEEILASSSEEDEDQESPPDEASQWAAGSMSVMIPTKDISPILLMAD